MKLKGFTLIELVVVIAMISVLALTSMVGYDRFISRAQDAKAEEVMVNLQTEVFATTAFSGATVNVGTGAAPVYIKVVYDKNIDRIFFYKAQSAPSEEESVKALEIIFADMLDGSTWDINPLNNTPLEALYIYYDFDTFLTIDYTASFGGQYVWKPTYTRASM